MSILGHMRIAGRKFRGRLFPKSIESDLNLIRDSGYFDFSWYRQNNPDVTIHDIDPLLHFMLYGGSEGRSPGPKFDSVGYLESNPDVKRCGVNPLVHFLKYGYTEGRSPYGLEHENEIIADMLALQKHYMRLFGTPIDFQQPSRYTEKLQILKLAYRNPILTSFADKAIAKETVGKIIGEQYIVPLIGIYDRFEDIPRGQLPEQFVIKANHGSGFNIICLDKSSFNWENAKQKTENWLSCDFSMLFREWCYRNIKRKLIVEQLVSEDERIPPDLKLHVFNGKVKEVQFIYDRDIGLTSTVHLTPDWRKLPYSINLPMFTGSVERPQQMDQIIDLAEKLAQDLPHVRVDFFLGKKQIFFSEMTFYPAAGLAPYQPPEWDKITGEHLDISKLYIAEYFEGLSNQVLEDIPPGLLMGVN